MTPPTPLALSLPDGVWLGARAVALCRAALLVAIDEQRRRGLPPSADAAALLGFLASITGPARTAAGPSPTTPGVAMSAAGPSLASAVLADASFRDGMTVREAADALGVKARQVRRLLTTGALTGQKVGPLWTVDRVSVAGYRPRRAAA